MSPVKLSGVSGVFGLLSMLYQSYLFTIQDTLHLSPQSFAK